MRQFRFFAVVAGFLALAAPAISQEAVIPFGEGNHNTSAPVEVTSDQLNVDQKDGSAVFTGNVIVIQDDMRMTAPRVQVLYNEDTRKITNMLASGGVTVVKGDQAAEGQEADYDVSGGVIVLTTNVLVTQGQSAIASDRMVVDLDAGNARASGRVKSIFQTEGQ